MPTYDYRCNACDHTFDLVQTMSSSVKRKCPACARLKLERLIGTGAGFIIKGRTSSSPQRDTPSKPEANDAASAKTEPVASDASASESPGPKALEPDAPASKPAEQPAKVESPPAEKRISGATSTPTHKAREGRGVGNLVDKARRLADKKSASKPKPATKSKPAAKSKPSKTARGRTKRG